MLSVNGAQHAVRVDTRVTLLDTLRDELGLVGSKKGCDQGQCGACTVHVDGERHLACLTLTVAAQGVHITTIEGLADDDGLHPMQEAFIEHDGFQCGYLCRCAAYPNIVAAVRDAKKRMEDVG